MNAAAVEGRVPDYPDLSGIYNHQEIPGFEPLASGPTSLVNLSRREGNVANNRQLIKAIYLVYGQIAPRLQT